MEHVLFTINHNNIHRCIDYRYFADTEAFFVTSLILSATLVTWFRHPMSVHVSQPIEQKLIELAEKCILIDNDKGEMDRKKTNISPNINGNICSL